VKKSMNMDGSFPPFSADEHGQFLAALQIVGGGDVSCLKGNEWESICAHVGGSRSVQDIKLHAFRYLLVLQAVAPRTSLAPDLRDHSSPPWTFEEDAIFEQVSLPDLPYINHS